MDDLSTSKSFLQVRLGEFGHCCIYPDLRDHQPDP